jgi:hypothetical protein
MKHLTSLGKELIDKSKEISNSITMINSDTDLKIFIDENRTNNCFVKKIEFKAYE